MSTEGIDIVVTRTGADEAADSINKIGDAGLKAALGAANANDAVAAMAQSIAAANPTITNFNSIVATAEGMLRANAVSAQRAGISLDEFNSKTAALKAGLDDSTAATKDATAAVDKHVETVDKAAHSTTGLSEASSLLREALTALGLALSLDKIIDLSEAYQKVELQVRSVSRTSEEAAATQKSLYDISQLTGSSFAQNVGAFQKLATETSNLGVDQKDLLSVIKNVNLVVQQSGGTSEQAAQAVELFGRALATGQVQGRQIRTVLLDFPQLGKLAADGLGTTTQALTSMSNTATHTSKEFIDGFNKAAESAGIASKTIDLTLTASITLLGNAMLAYVGKVESANGITQTMSNAIAFIARNFEAFATAIEVAVTAVGSYYLVLVAIPGVINLITSSVTRLTAAILANPFGFMLVALTTLIALVYEFGASVKVTSDGSITALGAMIGTFNFIKAKLIEVYTYIATNWGPTISRIFEGTVTIVTNLAKAIQIVLQWVGLLPIGFDAVGASAEGAATHTKSLTDYMTEATAKMADAHDAAGNLASALDDTGGGAGGGGGKSVAAGAKGAGAAVDSFGRSLDSLGRYIKDLAPLQTDLFDREQFLLKQAQEAWKAYTQDVEKATKAAQDNALMTENAMGDMVKATDEWARRSGEDFNSVAGAAKQMQTAVAAADTAVSSASSSAASHENTTGSSSGGFSFGYGRGGNDVEAFLRNGQLPGGPNPYGQLLLEGNFQNDDQRNAFASMVTAAAKAAHAPGFASGGDFVVGGSGGTDSQLVQFYASPDERVSVQTPAQQKQGGGGKSVVVNMVVKTPDGNSFRRSQNQILLSLQSKLNQVH